MSSLAEPRVRRWRRVEYDRLVDMGLFADERLELLDGVLVVREPQKSPHAATVEMVARAVGAAFGAGWHVRRHSPLALDDVSEPEPDVAVVAGEPEDYFTEHPTTAALIVEVADSSLAFDRTHKASLYARAGLAEFWIVDLVNMTLIVHRDPAPSSGAPHGAAYRSVDVLRRPATVTPLAATTSIAVAHLLRG
ncbi:MAG: Uma2 family endonuclease [Candidatus Rokubacteria bacterium]|nr:Uma2 family endonuclease [Candidatus Rokubacteria bacterium]